MPTEANAATFCRAYGYPFPRPRGSYAFVNPPSGIGAPQVIPFDAELPGGLQGATKGELWPCRAHTADGETSLAEAVKAVTRKVSPPDVSKSVWVLAIGSNASPEQLARKYPARDYPGLVIPVVSATLEDFDVVWAPLLASYGSVTATLARSEGCRLSLHATLLDSAAMGRMHSTEGGYDFCVLKGVRLHPDGSGPTSTTALAYLHKVGPMRVAADMCGRDVASPVAIAELSCAGRTLPEMTQSEVQRTAAQMVKHVGSVDGFVRTNLENDAMRIRHTRKLEDSAGTLGYPVTVLTKLALDHSLTSSL
eukprot:TRINITY_DN36954_c0_g1_i1.p1 TRINITY_DN36954_c0_g1~~TRINITY_DN36954_c0_g1_i1.p1  ORF type:complete len:308 (+),score=59.56 TRINITY_DN36954_c0_g1_i1:49-972(+)